MTRRRLESVLWGISVLFIALTIVEMRNQRLPATVTDRPTIHAAAVRMFDEDALADAADTVAANDLFRLDRRPSTVAFGVVPPPVTLAPPRPVVQLALGGVIGGPPWRAIVTGIPGRDGGVVVNAGDTLGGLRVRTVRRDTVVITGRDTTWTLTVRH